MAARDRALDSANEQLRKVLEHNVLLSQENEIANQEAQRVSTDRDQLAHQLAVKVEEEEREAAACMAPGDEAHQDDEVRSLRRRLAYWRARDKSRDEQREEEKEAWRRDAAAHNSQRVAQDKVVARAQEESTKLAQEVARLSALLGEANAEARRLAAVVERAGQQTAEMEWRLVEQVEGLEASLEKLAAAAAGSHAKHAHDTAEQERRHQLLCQQVEARMQAKSQALIDAQRRREQEAEEAASARVARVEESAEVELGHVREESRALSEAHMTIGAHLLAQITQADALLSATMALARHEEEARLRAASGARALEAAEAEHDKAARGANTAVKMHSRERARPTRAHTSLRVHLLSSSWGRSCRRCLPSPWSVASRRRRNARARPRRYYFFARHFNRPSSLQFEEAFGSTWLRYALLSQ